MVKSKKDIKWKSFWNGRSRRFYGEIVGRDGKPKQVPTPFVRRHKDKADADKYVASIAPKVYDGLSVDNSPTEMSLEELLVGYRERLVSRNNSLGTVKCYEDASHAFSKYLTDLHQLSNPLLSNISFAKCDDFITDSFSQRSLATVAKHYRHLKAMFNYAKKRGAIGENPWKFIEPPIPDVADKDFFKTFELKHLLGAIPCESYRNIRLRNIIRLGYLTGGRLSELLHLQVGAINIPEQRISFKNTATSRTKSRKDRTLRLNADAIRCLKEQLKLKAEQPEDAIRNSVYVFPSLNGKALSKEGISRSFTLHRKSVFPARKLTFHSLRRSFATYLHEKGTPIKTISRLLGHYSVQTTETYLGVHDLDVKDAPNCLLALSLDLNQPHTSFCDLLVEESEEEKMEKLMLELYSAVDGLMPLVRELHDHGQGNAGNSRGLIVPNQCGATVDEFELTF